MIPFLDLQAVAALDSEEISDAVLRVVSSGRYILGPELEAFEQEFAIACGVDAAVGVGSGLAALTLLLRAFEIGPGDEVIVPSNTYIATWLAVSATGAVPIPLEPDECSSNISRSGLADAVTSRTRAVLAVHLYGQVVDLPYLRENLPEEVLLLEDAAQAHGATSPRGVSAGALGDGAAFSFYPTKNMGALGDGGAITVNSTSIAEHLRVLRNYGSRRKYENEVRGYNSRLDELQAAVLRVRLRKLSRHNARRKSLALRYLAGLRDVEDLRLPCASSGSSSWHVFVVHTAMRDWLQTRLTAKGIGTQIFYPTPPHLSGAYADLGYAHGSFPVAERLAAQNLALPLNPALSDDEVDFVIETVANTMQHG